MDYEKWFWTLLGVALYFLIHNIGQKLK